MSRKFLSAEVSTVRKLNTTLGIYTIYHSAVLWCRRCCLLLKASALLHLSESALAHPQRMSLFGYHRRCLDVHHLPPQPRIRVKSGVSPRILALHPAECTLPLRKENKKKRSLLGFVSNESWPPSYCRCSLLLHRLKRCLINS